MALSFEDLLLNDRPLLPFEVEIGGVKYPFQARRPNAMEQDAIDGFYDDEYARKIIEKTEPHNGRKPELNEQRETFGRQDREYLTQFVLGTRAAEIDRDAQKAAGIDQSALALELLALSKEDQDTRLAEIGEQIASAQIAVRNQYAQEYETKSVEELADVCAQVSVNIRAITEARRAQQIISLAYVVYDLDGKKYFPNPDAVVQMRPETIQAFMSAVSDAYVKARRGATVPLASQAAPARSGRRSSRRNSAAGTEAGGKPTATNQTA